MSVRRIDQVLAGFAEGDAISREALQLRGFSDSIESSLVAAREQLFAMAARCDILWADSRFDAEELEQAGLKNVRVLELPSAPAPKELKPDPRIVQRFSSGDLCNILFVGRIAPDKRIEDLILMFAWYQLINPFCRLVIVGSPRSAPKYYLMLRMLANEMNLANVCFEGYASPEGAHIEYPAAVLRSRAPDPRPTRPCGQGLKGIQKIDEPADGGG